MICMICMLFVFCMICMLFVVCITCMLFVIYLYALCDLYDLYDLARVAGMEPVSSARSLGTGFLGWICILHTSTARHIITAA